MYAGKSAAKRRAAPLTATSITEPYPSTPCPAPSYPPWWGISLWRNSVICPVYLAGHPVNLWLKAQSAENQQQIG
ncbi:hypothetical protein ABVD01_21665, partial [Xanthomonas euvesicatoria]